MEAGMTEEQFFYFYIVYFIALVCLALLFRKAFTKRNISALFLVSLPGYLLGLRVWFCIQSLFLGLFDQPDFIMIPYNDIIWTIMPPLILTCALLCIRKALIITNYAPKLHFHSHPVVIFFCANIGAMLWVGVLFLVVPGCD